MKKSVKVYILYILYIKSRKVYILYMYVYFLLCEILELAKLTYGNRNLISCYV